jgi:hypothetical protein
MKNMKPCSGEGNERRPIARHAIRSLMIAAVVVACAPDLSHESRPSRSIVTDVIVTVENRTSQPSLIYLQFGDRSDSLGEVPRRSARSFSLPSSAGDSTTALQLEARHDPIVPGARSPSFHLSPGHQVIWTVDGVSSGVTMR